MSETTPKEVSFRSNFMSVTVCNCHFLDHIFTTDDPEKIVLLRNKKATGDGVLIEEVDLKKIKKVESKPDPLGDILNSITACKDLKSLENVFTEIEKKFPNGEGLESVQRAKLTDVFHAQKSALEQAVLKSKAAADSSKSVADRKKKGEPGKKAVKQPSRKEAKATKKATKKKGK